MSASIKVVLRKKPNKEGKYPLAVRVTKDRKSSFHSIGYYIDEKFWHASEHKVKKSHPNSAHVNNLIAARLAEASKEYLEMEVKNPNAQAETITKAIARDKNYTFFKVAEQHLKNLEKTKQHTRYNSDKPRIDVFKGFTKTKNLHFDTITVSYLKRFASYMMHERNVSERTVMNYFALIRTIFKQALADKIIDNEIYPFGRGKLVIKFPESIKIGLTREEVSRLEDCVLEENSSTWHARNIWLLSFYFAGMRTSDVLQLKWADIADGRMFDQMDKNNKVGSTKIFDRPWKIIQLYKQHEQDGYVYIFPFLEDVTKGDSKYLRHKINNATHLCDQHLKQLAKNLKITKPLSMHIARHTFGNISGDKIPIQMLQKLYRHSSITTTIGYQANFMFKDTDEALEAVIG